MSQSSTSLTSQEDSAKRTTRVFTTADPKYRRRLWVRVSTPEGPRVVVAWRLVSLYATLALALTWLAGSGVIYGYLSVRNPGATISFVNVAWPFRWPRLRTELGRYYLGLGHESYAHHELDLAISRYTAGLARYSDDLVARRRLAQLYFDSSRWQLALQALTAGLPVALAAGDQDYVQHTFRSLLDCQENSRALELARKFLPTLPDSQPIHLSIAFMASTACMQMADYDAAVLWLSQWQLTDSVQGQLLLANIDVEKGNPALALHRLRERMRQAPQQTEYYSELVKLLQQLGRNKEALQEAEQRVNADRSSFLARLDLCSSLLALGDKFRLMSAVDDYLVDFGAQPKALQMLAGFAVQSAQPEIAVRTKSIALAHGNKAESFGLAVVESLIKAGLYQGAFEEVGGQLDGRISKETESMLIGFLSAAAFGMGYPSDGEVGLQKLSERTPLPDADVYKIACLIEQTGYPTVARRLLKPLALRRAASMDIVVKLVQLDLKLNDVLGLAQDLPLLLAFPKAPATELLAAQRMLNDGVREHEALCRSIEVALSRTMHPVPSRPGL